MKLRDALGDLFSCYLLDENIPKHPKAHVSHEHCDSTHVPGPRAEEEGISGGGSASRRSMLRRRFGGRGLEPVGCTRVAPCDLRVHRSQTCLKQGTHKFPRSSSSVKDFLLRRYRQLFCPCSCLLALPVCVLALLAVCWCCRKLRAPVCFEFHHRECGPQGPTVAGTVVFRLGEAGAAGPGGAGVPQLRLGRIGVPVSFSRRCIHNTIHINRF